MLVESASWSQWQMMALSSTICFLNKTTHEPIGTNILKSDSAALALAYRTSEKGKWLSLLIDFRKQGSNKKHKKQRNKTSHSSQSLYFERDMARPDTVFYIFLRPLPKKKLRKNRTMRIFIKTRQPRAISWKGFPFVLFKQGCVQTRPYPLVLLDILANLPPFLTSQCCRDWTTEMLPCPQVISRQLIWPRILHSFNNLLNPVFAIADWTCGMSW